MIVLTLLPQEAGISRILVVLVGIIERWFIVDITNQLRINLPALASVRL